MDPTSNGNGHFHNIHSHSSHANATCSTRDSYREVYNEMDSPGARALRDDFDDSKPTIIYQPDDVPVPEQYQEFSEGQHYILKEPPLREGGFGKIYLCTKGKLSRRHTPDDFVVKMIPKQEFNTTEIDVPISLCRWKEFIKILLVVREKDYIKIFLPYAKGWDLTHQSELSFDFNLEMTKSLTEDLIALHEHNIVHFDIKPQNVVIFIEDNNKPHAKFIDFGSAKLEGRNFFHENYSTINMVPEGAKLQDAFERNRANKGWYDESLLKPVDVFQHGALIYFIYSRKFFLKDRWEASKERHDTVKHLTKRHEAKEEHKQMIQCLTQDDVNKIIEETEFKVPEPKKGALKELLKRLLNPDPQLRPIMTKELMDHEFFKNNSAE